jgi:hypothetical protein
MLTSNTTPISAETMTNTLCPSQQHTKSYSRTKPATIDMVAVTTETVQEAIIKVATEVAAAVAKPDSVDVVDVLDKISHKCLLASDRSMTISPTAYLSITSCGPFVQILYNANIFNTNTLFSIALFWCSFVA